MFYEDTNRTVTTDVTIPKDWDIKVTKDLFYVKGRIGWRGLKRAHFTKDGPFLITGVNFHEGDIDWRSCFHIPTEKFLESPEIIVQKDDILLTKDGTIGKVARVTKIPNDGRATINAHIFLIRNLANNGIYPCYTYYALQTATFLSYVRKSQTGSTRAGFSQEKFEKLPFPVPPYEEQQKIIEVLSAVDEAIQKTNEVIVKTEHLKRGLMRELLTKGIGHKEFKGTEIGRIPKEWEVMGLGDALDLCQYGLSLPMSQEGRYPIIRMDELADGYVISEVTKKVDLDESTFRQFKLEKGDVLFNRTNSYELVGRTGIFLLEGDYVFASYLIRLKPKKELLDSNFLTLYLTFSRDRLKQMATKAVHQANINATNLRRIKVPLPCLNEQERISEILSSTSKQLDIVRGEEARLERVKLGLMDLLLTGKVRVKVN